MSDVRASVILCTRNRSQDLAHALDSILGCEVTDDAYEVIVVDNASVDETPAVVEARLAASPPGRLRLLREDRLGKHFAQHVGARAARSDLLLYTDDDVEVAPNWIQAYVDAFAAHPDLLAAGGPVHPIWAHEPPQWLLDYMSRDEYSVTGSECCGPLALMDRGDQFLSGPDGYFFGNNMAIRYSALERFGGFRPGRAGGESIGPGEWAIVEGMQRSGTPIGYVPAAVVRHQVPAPRMTIHYFETWPGPQDEMFDRWHGRKRTVGALASDVRRILSESWRPWLRRIRAHRRRDADGLSIRVRAARGRMELRWLWWMVTRRELRTLLDTEQFGP